MTINQLYQELEELRNQYTKALNTISILEKKLKKLEAENKQLKEEIKRLQRINNILYRAIELAAKMKNTELQIKFLKEVLRNAGE